MACIPKAKLFEAYITPFVQVDAAGLVFPEATLDITGGNNRQKFTNWYIHKSSVIL